MPAGFAAESGAPSEGRDLESSWELKAGDFVRMKGNTSVAGVLQDVREVRGRKTASVQFPTGMRRIPLKELELVPMQVDDPVAIVRKGQFSGPASLRQRIAHVRLSGNLSDIFYSMESTDTDFYAHQFKPVVKILDSPTGNLLIADEVGLGKTIEAGLIWNELVARFKYNRFLVVCPKVLCEKWRLELTTKFGIDARVCNASDLTELFSSTFHQRNGFVAICGMQGIRPRPKNKRSNRPADKLADLLEEEQISDKLVDLLVIDEAHHIRNVGTQTNRLGELLCGIATHTVMLSATPLNLHNRDLHTLLKLLDELTFRDERALERIIRANQPLIAARDAVLTGKPLEEIEQHLEQAASDTLLQGARSLGKLREDITKAPELFTPVKRAQMARRLERLNLLSNVVNRTRRRDVEEFRVVRNVSAFRAELTPDERAVYDAITDAVLNYAWENDLPVGFLTVMPQRMLASSLPAALQHWRNKSLITDYEDEDSDESNENETWKQPLTQLLSRVSRNLPEPSELEAQDTKYNTFLNVLQSNLSTNTGEKIVVFSTFRSTLRYLARRLKQSGVQTAMLHGEIEDRVGVISSFKENKDVAVLLASEVGSEGIDLQFARTLVNYDLPWNPMRVEQRIGRIDRLGQAAEIISVLNLLHKNTVDERIYHRLHERLGLCKSALGGFEEILGHEISSLTSDLFSGMLTHEEQEQRLIQAEQAIANRREEEELLEKEAAALIAHGDYILHSIKEAKTSGNWISDGDIVGYLEFTLGIFDPASSLQWEKDKGLVHVKLTGAGRHDLEDWCRTNQLPLGPIAKSGASVTFRVGTKSENSRYPRLGPSHPLIRFLSNYLSEKGGLEANVIAVTLERAPAVGLQPGLYIGNVQAWQYGKGSASISLAYSMASVSDGSLLDAELAETVTNICLSQTQKWQGAKAEVNMDEVADVLESVVEPNLEERFFEEGERRKNEMEDRIFIQLKTLEEHARNQRETFKETIRRSGPRLEAANKARLKKFEETIEKRRRQIERQRIAESSARSVGSILVKVFS